ncbi:intermembrane phospholipid transport protein YdbH family protein [Sneathiella aquimaris]|uniref:intermembrane phospholipid transport protein YdbH family protein n=1 Tax=Sneathiella aquimaris TaxID=2599305 RepID=UPI00146BEA8B|nr:YdbH domain-containing protein [Sneathiella aquimaris]
MIIVGSVLVVLLAFFLARVPIAELTATTYLKSNGFPVVQIEIEDVGFNEIRLSSVEFGPDLSVKEVAAGYSIPALLDGKVEWISLNGIYADISELAGGSFAAIRRLVGQSASDTVEVETERLFPLVNLTNATIVQRVDGRQFEAIVNGLVTSDNRFAGQIRAMGAIETQIGPVLLEKLSINVRGDLASLTGQAVIESGVIRHEAPVPKWSAVQLSGQATSTGGALNFYVTTGLGDTASLFRLQGTHNVQTGDGKAVFDIQDIAFDKEGLQPSDLSSLAKDIPPLNAIVSSQTQLDWSSRTITAMSDFQFKNIEVIGPGYSFQSKSLALSARSHLDLQSYEHTVAMTGLNQIGNIVYNADRFSFQGMDLRVQGGGAGKQLALEQLRVTVSHQSKTPYFAPLILSMTGQRDEDIFSMKGEMQDRQETLSLPFDAQYDFSNNTAQLTGRFRHKAFAPGHLQPGDFSAYLADIPGRISGNVDLDFTLNWSAEAGPRFSLLTAQLQKLGYLDRHINLSPVSAKVEAKNISVAQPFQVAVTNLQGFLNASGERLGFRGATLKAEVTKGWEAIKLSLGKLVLFPLKGARLKQETVFTGGATIIGETAEVNIEASNDFLGPFLAFEGQHNLSAGTGVGQVILKPLRFEEEGIQPSDFVSGIDKSLKVNGTVSAKSALKWSQSGVNSKAEFEIGNLNIAQEAVSVIGLNGTVKVDELFPFTIRQTQQIVAREIVSAVTIINPRLKFRVLVEGERPILYLDEMNVGLVGGTAVIENEKIDIGAVQNKVMVSLANLDLEQVMALGDVEDFTASGTLNGKVPLLFDGDRVLIDVGYLEAAGPGLLQLKSEKARSALRGGGEQTKLLFDILENFRYSELSIKIRKQESGTDTVTLHTKGANPDVENNRAVVLNINLETNLDKILNTVLDGYRLSEKALRATVGRKRK